MDVVKRKVYELVYLRLEKEGLEMFLKSVLFSLFDKIVNKFVASDELMKNKIDICLISETKVDESFPNQQFKINGYKMFRKDRDRFGGGLMFYVNEQIPSKVLSLESIPMDIELILLEFTVKNRR